MNITGIPSIGFIGGGNMARSIIGGLMDVGLSPECVFVADPMPSARESLSSDFGVHTTEHNRHAVKKAAILVLAVKPQVMMPVLGEINDQLQQARPLLISIAAGIRLSQIDELSGGGLPIVRVMPNTPALIRQGMSALCANAYATKEHRERSASVLEAVGKTVWLEDEMHMDAITAVSGSGPAYFFYLIEALQEAAEQLGLPSAISRTLSITTAVGAAMLANQSEHAPAQLRQQVTSPGGVTQAALQTLERANVKDEFVKAVIAGKKRSEELSAT